MCIFIPLPLAPVNTPAFLHILYRSLQKPNVYACTGWQPALRWKSAFEKDCATLSVCLVAEAKGDMAC